MTLKPEIGPAPPVAAPLGFQVSPMALYSSGYSLNLTRGARRAILMWDGAETAATSQLFFSSSCCGGPILPGQHSGRQGPYCQRCSQDLSPEVRAALLTAGGIGAVNLRPRDEDAGLRLEAYFYETHDPLEAELRAALLLEYLTELGRACLRRYLTYVEAKIPKAVDL